MNHVQALDSRPNVEQPTRDAFPVDSGRATALHRLGEARRQENISRRNVANHLGITVQDVRRQECATADLPLSALHEWGKALGLPVAELIEEPSEALSTPLFKRAGLVRVMKTAMAILERTGDPRTNRLAQTLVGQLLEIMPDLRGVAAWPTVGKRRRLDELGIAAERTFSDEAFMNMVD